MQSEIRTPIALGHRYKRNYLFLTSSLLHYEASVADSPCSAPQQSSSEIKSPFFLIVHHNVCFHRCSIRWFAGYLWQSPAEGHSSSSDQFIGQFCSLDLHMICWSLKESSIFCTASPFLQLNEVQDTHVCVCAIVSHHRNLFRLFPHLFISSIKDTPLI